MSIQKVRKESKFIRFMKGPVKILARARDFYVRSLTRCAGNTSYSGAAVGVPNLQFSGLPRSFSSNSSYSDYSSREEDLRELMRIASTRSLAGKVEAELRQPSSVGAGGVEAVSRSRSVAIERIDEEKAYEFGVNDVVGVGPKVYPRSRSYAPPRSSMV